MYLQYDHVGMMFLVPELVVPACLIGESLQKAGLPCNPYRADASLG